MRATPIKYYKSVNSNFFMFGIEKEVFFLLLALCLPIAFSGRFSLVMILLSFMAFLLFYMVALVVTRIDPQIIKIYRRHILYKTYYQPISLVSSNTPRVMVSVPYYQGKRGLV